jgi:hypothetical protein
MIDLRRAAVTAATAAAVAAAALTTTPAHAAFPQAAAPDTARTALRAPVLTTHSDTATSPRVLPPGVSPADDIVCSHGDSIWTFDYDLFVSAEFGYPASSSSYGMLRARSDSIGPWEKFTIGCYSNGNLVLVSQANGLVVSAEFGYPASSSSYGMLRARSHSIGAWEGFHSFYWTCPS